MLDRLRSAIDGLTAPRAEVMSVNGEEPCEECGATPADVLVGVRWLCPGCAPAARREEAVEMSTPAPGGPGAGAGD